MSGPLGDFVLAMLLAVVIAATTALDTFEAEQPSTALADAQQAARHAHAKEQAIARTCGINAGYREAPDGSIECRLHNGKRRTHDVVAVK